MVKDSIVVTKSRIAQTYSNIAMYIAFFLAATIAIFTYNSRDDILPIYNIVAEEETIGGEIDDFFRYVRYLFVFFILWNSAREVMGGILRGADLRMIAVTWLTIGVLLFGLPLELIFTVKLKTKFFGIWFGLNVGMASACLAYFYTMWDHDFEMSTFKVLQEKEAK